MSVHGGVLSQHALQVVSQHALQQVSLGGLQVHIKGESGGGSGPCPQPRGKLRGIWSRRTPKGEVEGDLPGGGGACSGGCLVLGVPGGDPPPGRLLLRAERILLECILVKVISSSQS